MRYRAQELGVETQHVTIRIPAEDLSKAREIAHSLEMSRNDWIREAVSEHITNHYKPPNGSADNFDEGFQQGVKTGVDKCAISIENNPRLSATKLATGESLSTYLAGQIRKMTE